LTKETITGGVRLLASCHFIYISRATSKSSVDRDLRCKDGQFCREYVIIFTSNDVPISRRYI